MAVKRGCADTKGEGGGKGFKPHFTEEETEAHRRYMLPNDTQGAFATMSKSSAGW